MKVDAKEIKKMIYTRFRIQASALIVAMIVLSLFSQQICAGECDYALAKQRLDAAYMYYEKGEYDRARAMTDRLIKKIFGESDTGGLEYPTSITLNLKYLDKLLKDKEGYFDSLCSFTGIANVIYAATTGYFEVKGKKETKEFGYDRDVLIKGDGFFHGKRVTVYYKDFKFLNAYTALKIVVHP